MLAEFSIPNYKSRWGFNDDDSTDDVPMSHFPASSRDDGSISQSPSSIWNIESRDKHSDWRIRRLPPDETPSLEYVVTHVFFHVYHPEYEDDSPKNEHSLFCAVRAAVDTYHEYIDSVHKPHWCHITKMLESLQVTVQARELNSDHVVSQLGGLKPGDILVFPIHSQNVGIIFRKQNDYTLYEAFQLLPDIHQNEPKKVLRSYPEIALKIPNEIFDDSAFLFQLSSFLSVMSVKTDNIAGERNSHTIEALNGILRSVGQSGDATPLTKRVCHQIGGPASQRLGEEEPAKWSRSSLWLLIRVAVHSSLNRSPLGCVTYKEFMLFFMSKLANEAVHVSLSSDLLHLITTKLLRRFRKLGSDVPKWLSDSVLQTCTHLSETLDGRWIEFQAAQSSSAPWDPSQLDLAKDVQLPFARAAEYISRSFAHHGNDRHNPPFLPCHFPRGTLHDFMSSGGRFFGKAYRDDPHLALYDFERAIEQSIDDWIACVMDVDAACVELKNMADKYLSSARRSYDHPEQLSIMVLTALELWVALDKLVVREIPVLADYSPEVPLILLEKLLFREPVNRHRYCHAYQYISARHTGARPGWSVFSIGSTGRSPPFRYEDSPPSFAGRLEKDALPASRIHGMLELQGVTCFRIWQSVTTYFLEDNHPSILSRPTYSSLVYSRQWSGFRHGIDDDGERRPLSNPGDFTFSLPNGPYEHLERYADNTTYSSNEVLSSQADCHADLTLHEFIAFGQLRSGGSVQWINMLRELRSRSLNFRRHEVNLLFTRASTQLGPVSDVGELMWHWELQDPLFCHALLDELESLFLDIGSLDGEAMGTISLFACLLASCPSADISVRAIEILRNVRGRTFDWVNELLYNVVKSPTSQERRQLLVNMAAICRSTLNVGPSAIGRLLYSAQDVEMALSCATLIRTTLVETGDHMTGSDDLRVMMERDRRLSFVLEGILRDVIRADVSDLGVDLAVRRVWSSYRPGPRRWEFLPYPNSHWLACETAEARDRRSQTVHLNLLDGSLFVDGKPIGGKLPSRILQHQLYHLVFRDSNFNVITSDLQGMDFVTQFMIYEHNVHFSLHGDNLVIRAQRKDEDDIFELIPHETFEGDLPDILIEGHAHWLNMSTSTIEIRPLTKLWERSSENWWIHLISGKYHMTKGRESLVDIRSPSWKMASRRMECLDLSENMIITTSPVNRDQTSPSRRLSVTLPRYGLSFFVNANGDLESHDFKDMVYDENQCIGTLFGLVNRLVLRPKSQIEVDFVPRLVLIPDGVPSLDKHGHQLYVRINTFEDPNPKRVLYQTYSTPDPRRPVTYHTYKVDSELGCLAGIPSTKSRMYLARLHALTGSGCRPDPLTGRTGMEEAISLVWSAGIRKFTGGGNWSSRSPQLSTALSKVHDGYYTVQEHSYAILQEAYLFPSELAQRFPVKVKGSECDPRHRDAPSLSETLVYTAASAVYHLSVDASLVSDLSNWEDAWGDTITGNTAGAQWDNESIRSTMTKIYDLLERREGASWRFHLVFSIPIMVLSSLNTQATLLSMLLAFAKQPRPLQSPMHRAEYNLLDGYFPTRGSFYTPIFWARHGGLAYGDHRHEREESAAIDQLLEYWPSETLPTISLDPDNYDIAALTTNLRRIFSSSHRNSRLKEHLTHVCCGPRPLSFPSPAPESSVDTRSHEYWRITLGRLLSERPAPELPDYNRPFLHSSSKHHNAAPGPDIAPLAQLFSCLQTHETVPAFQRTYVSRLLTSAEHCHTVRTPNVISGMTPKPPVEELQSHYRLCRAKFRKGLDILTGVLGPRNEIEQLLERSGQWPRVTPYTLFRCLASTSPITLSDNWKMCLVSLARLALELQRARRLLQFSLENLDEELRKELENRGCDGWNAEDHTDWLLIQLQGNVLIRQVQADIAKEMISPHPRENMVMQVNMGEGKSSVITPICATVLADGHQLVRVIVPKPLDVQMVHLLTDRLGGLVNRPIYHMSFSRHDPDYHISTLHSTMSECKDERGVLVMQPEHVLSLKLTNVEKQFLQDKTGSSSSPMVQKWNYDHTLTDRLLKSLTQSTYVATILAGVKRWLPTSTEERAKRERHRDIEWALKHAREIQELFDSHARDILDESDVTLHPRTQLIYAIGLEQHMEGFPNRWTITQKVLGLAKKHASFVSSMLLEKIETEQYPAGSYPRIHIRQAEASSQLISLIAEDVVDGRLFILNFNSALKNAIREFISRKDILPETAKMVKDYAHQSVSWGVLLLLRGLLAHNILLFALTERRWRVDYGLDPNRKPPTLLAVPYRAKDVPAPTAEFGHPDLIIVLTCLSYYYGGLSEEQLRISFEILLEQDDASSHYALWLDDCDFESLPESVRNLNNVNIRSSEQWDRQLLPLFSRNQGAIDFYLSKVVFPKHAKEFPWKISASGWDIAERRKNLVTGFSGTNDGQYLLPLSIGQNDPGHLHQTGTNAKILAYLLQAENDSYMVTAHNHGERCATHEFLTMVVSQKPTIRVLLDVGAQILDLSNRQVAMAWLDLSSQTDTAGAIYFDEDDQLVVLTRNGFTHPLSSSPLLYRLDRCVAYLDDAHTRGTDIKFPRGFRGAVTLGPKVTKDRLVQGCMRMRKLGNGHSVMFFAPPEVDRKIRSVAAKEDQNIRITPTDILHWAIRETWTDIQIRAPYWALQGTAYKQQSEAWSRFFRDELTNEQFAESWIQPESRSLADLYAPRHSPNSKSSMVILTDRDIRQRCHDLGVTSLHDASLEEREREVFREIEREREVERPPRASPAWNYLHSDVIAFVKTGAIPLPHNSAAFRPIFTTLNNTSATVSEAHIWSPYILATADFCETIVEPGLSPERLPGYSASRQSSRYSYRYSPADSYRERAERSQGRVDQYLRPVQWVLSGKLDRNDVLILLSPFEADILMPDIRVSQHVHLHLYTPRTTKDMKSCDDLKLYSIPPVPSDWIPPWTLIDQLNLFAGQLYLRDFATYIRVSRFLGLHTDDLPGNAGSSLRRNWFQVPGSFGAETEIELSFNDSPLPFVMMLLAIRRKGMDFAQSHIGRILQGELLTEEDF